MQHHTRLLDLIAMDSGTILTRSDVFHREDVLDPVPHQLHPLAGQIPRGAQLPGQDGAY